MASMDHALSLLTAASNHSDLTVKLSSLKQAKDILLSIDPSLVSELFPYLLQLQYAPDSLVRKMLLEIIEVTALKAMDHCCVLIHVLLAFLRDSDASIARQSIVTGTNLFCSVLEEIASQLHGHKKVERWLEELWILMLQLKDSIFAIALEPGSVGTKLLALKFLETYVLLFTPDTNDAGKNVSEAAGPRRLFNISWLVGGSPVLDTAALTSDANRTLDILLDILRSPGSLPGSLTIAVVNCLAAIARKRPLHYVTVLSALLDFDPNLEAARGWHTASIQYSMKTACLGFLRCTHPAILESRDRLLRALRSMNFGDAADLVIRQIERASREARFSRDDQLPGQLLVPGDQLRKRSVAMDNGEPFNGHEVPPKRIRHGSNPPLTMPAHTNDMDQNLINGVSANNSLLDNDPAEQMIAMIGALLAAGDRGSKSLEVLISTMHPDMLADIVITNMRHLPKSPLPLTKLGNMSATHQISSLSTQSQVTAPSAASNLVSPVPSAYVPPSAATANNSSVSELSTVSNAAMDSKRDPRRDPRRLDPRRIPSSIGVPSVPIDDNDTGPMQLESDGSVSLSKPLTPPVTTSGENLPALLMSNNRTDDKSLESPLAAETHHVHPREEPSSGAEGIALPSDVYSSSDHMRSPHQTFDEDPIASKLFDVEAVSGLDTWFVTDSDQLSPSVSDSSLPEEMCQDLPQLPLYIQLTEEQLDTERKLAVGRIIESYKQLRETDGSQTRMALLARLVARVVLIDADEDIVVMLQKHIVLDYRQQKGHELVLHILYHLNSLMILDSDLISSSAAIVYEKFLLAVAKSLLDTFPASDKSFSRLLGEVPFLPESCLKLLEDLCYSDVFDSNGKEVRDGERVTQGLGAVWGLILGRPNNRQACLDIALKCAVHSQEDIRAKAIRLVANKLYQLNYTSGDIELFATKMLLSAVDKPTSDAECSQSASSDQREREEVGGQVASVSGSQVSESGNGDNDTVRDAQSAAQTVSAISFAEAQRLISLYFALCTKKHSLLQIVFDIYGRVPKTVKQAVHRHTPVLIRALGSSYSELLCIISDPPEGCENLLMLVLQILTQETSSSADLIATVKHLYETKLKDATILIPVLSSFSKNEVLPIFPRLVGLPIEKFQMALAHILQGSAHTGPALTPAEVLVAIHDISPEKDGLALKKITDACSACFDQRTVFTQQVFAKALNQMVDQTPLPLLFMRTVIQAIDAFPSLVDFVMEILSKLVNRQVWKMPKLWVGFLKCVSQTRPHSFHVLLQLPPPQLESALSKHANLRGPLANYASQPSMKTSLPRSTLAVLGLVN